MRKSNQSELAIQAAIQKLDAMQDNLFADKLTYELIDTFADEINKRTAG